MTRPCGRCHGTGVDCPGLTDDPCPRCGGTRVEDERNPLLVAQGPVKVGETYVVGEEGPELFVLPQSGTIIPITPPRRRGCCAGETVLVVLLGVLIAALLYLCALSVGWTL